MICVHCGKELPDDARLCSFCGTNVVPNEEAPVDLEGNGVPVTEEVEMPKKKKKFPIGLVILAAIVAAAVCFSVLGMFCKSPLPIFNRTFAKYVPDYHGIYIGMPKDKALNKLLDEANITDISDGSRLTLITTRDKIVINGNTSIAELVSIEDGKVYSIRFAFPSRSKSAVEKYYMDMFGLKHPDWANDVGSVYVTKFTDSFVINLGSEKLELFFSDSPYGGNFEVIFWII